MRSESPAMLAVWRVHLGRTVSLVRKTRLLARRAGVFGLEHFTVRIWRSPCAFSFLPLVEVGSH